MAVQAKKLYLITAVIFILVIVLSYHKSSNSPSYGSNKEVDNNKYPQQQQQQQQQHQQQGDGQGDTSHNYDDNDRDYDIKKPSTPSQPSSAPSSVKTVTEPTVVTEPNTSGKYDTLILIPSSWTQIQNRQWVRQTVFGIKNNLTPCKKYDGKIIYKFYIHGLSSWLKTRIHSAEYMQGQVRELYAEFMEYNDHVFINKTVTDRHAIWGDALAWAVETFIPEQNIKVEKILIFDSTTIVNLPKIEESVKASMSASMTGFVQTWGGESVVPTTPSRPADLSTSITAVPFAGIASYDIAEQIVKNRVAIKENHHLLDIFTAATLYFASNPTSATVKAIKGPAQLWVNEIELVDATSQAVGQVYQLEDWIPIVEKLSVLPTPACAVDLNRKKNVAVLTSSYIYFDMCMAEASLPSAENKRMYAAKYGFDFVARAAEFIQEEFRGRRLVWGKIGAIQKVLPHYEWLLWMDMDAVIANMEKDVREIIREAETKSQSGQEISLIVAKPVKDKMLNAGVMLIKNTDWTRRFFNEVQTKVGWYRKSSYEQAAIWDVMTDPRWAPGVYLYDKDDHTMNTFPKYYAEGDFVIHFAPAGCPSVPVLEALRKIKDGESVLGVGAE
ncbi:hypothetical protein BX616_011189 [Lobosporangium transversale]|uniref:Galactosyl transferase GMA12/MNN10 family-domain-containing protein n=1 Tax=Lobosporangium transversale TaxID=64571 RepID=A0A1Y2GQZ2_9FUNG|nr:hypothetical protein BCR41DRAFT_421446 [Lobosporangium transversale]KAF9909401.1 hypothetical protein BX616_011189 [Lobosporangium transversale]ORZ19274.1 hypothetical protein BCR41DRAFT_421446 [Lobosporangium transversale]|eukprot:XP_021882442.1 hypothetical protein BCR41DRAFT_421446 [Lobosporangium transversale]